MIKAVKKWAVGFAGDYAKDYMTVANITQWIIDAVNALLARAMKNVDTDKLAKVCTTCANVSTLCKTLSDALADKTIAAEEAEKILADIKAIIGESGIDDKKIAEAIDKAVKAIKEKI